MADVSTLQRDNPFLPDSDLSHQADDIIKASTITRKHVEIRDPALDSTPSSPQSVNEVRLEQSEESAVQCSSPPPASPTGPASPQLNSPDQPLHAAGDALDAGDTGCVEELIKPEADMKQHCSPKTEADKREEPLSETARDTTPTQPPAHTDKRKTKKKRKCTIL